ncbi:hypothetical protein FHG87_012534, partial [Trinorchestia longiramus]
MSVDILAAQQETQSNTAEGGSNAEIAGQFILMKPGSVQGNRASSETNPLEIAEEDLEEDQHELESAKNNLILEPESGKISEKLIQEIEKKVDLNQIRVSESEYKKNTSNQSKAPNNEFQNKEGNLTELHTDVNEVAAILNVDTVVQLMPDNDRKRRKTVLENFIKSDAEITNEVKIGNDDERNEKTISNTDSEKKETFTAQSSEKTFSKIGEKGNLKPEAASLHSVIETNDKPATNLEAFEIDRENFVRDTRSRVKENEGKNLIINSLESTKDHLLDGSMAASTSFLPLFHPGTENEDATKRPRKDEQMSTSFIPVIAFTEPVEAYTKNKKVTFKKNADKSSQYPEELLKGCNKNSREMTHAVQTFTSAVDDNFENFNPKATIKTSDDVGNSTSLGRFLKSSSTVTRNKKIEHRNAFGRNEMTGIPSARIVEIQDSINDGSKAVHAEPKISYLMKPPKEVPIILDKYLYTVEVGKNRAKANKNRAIHQRSSVMTGLPADTTQVLRSELDYRARDISQRPGQSVPPADQGQQSHLVLRNEAENFVKGGAQAAQIPSYQSLQNYQPYPSDEFEGNSYRNQELKPSHEIYPTTLNKYPIPPGILSHSNTIKAPAFITKNNYSSKQPTDDRYPLPPIGQSHSSNYERLQQHNDLRRRFQNEPFFVAQQLTQNQNNINPLATKNNHKSNQAVRRNFVAKNRNKLVYHSNINLGLALGSSNSTSVGQNRNLSRSKSFESLPRTKLQDQPRSKSQSFADQTFANTEPNNNSYSHKKDQRHLLNSLSQHQRQLTRAPHNLTSSSADHYHQNPKFLGRPESSFSHLDSGAVRQDQDSRWALPQEQRYVLQESSLGQESNLFPNNLYQDSHRLQGTEEQDFRNPANMYYGAQSYGQPSYNAYGSNYDAGRRKSLGYDQNPSDYRRRSSSLDYEPSGAPRYSRRQSMADPFADDDERMSRQRLMEDLDYQIQEKKRLEEMRREKESYEERLLDQNIARQRKQMEEEYQREQALKMMKEEQRRKRYAAHQAYLASLEQQNRQSNQRHQSPPDSPEFSPPRSTEHELDPNSRYDAYDRTPVKGKGTYDLGSADKIGPRSKPPGFKPTKTLTPRPDKSRSSSNSSKPKPRSGDRMPDPSKALSRGSRASQSKPIAKKSASPDRTKLAPPKGKSPMVERKSKDNYINNNNNNNAPSKMDMSMTDLPKRRKIPSSDDRFEFGLNLNQASKITLEVQRDNNPFFDSKPGRRRKTPDPRKGKNEGQSASPSPQPQSPSNHLQASQSPPHSRTPSPQVSMDSEVQTSDASERKSERHRNEARDMAAQTMAPSIENSAQTFEEDFEPEKPPTSKPRPVPFDWKIKLDETTGDWRSKQEDDSKKEIETFEEQHKDLTSQLLAMKKGLK